MKRSHDELVAQAIQNHGGAVAFREAYNAIMAPPAGCTTVAEQQAFMRRRSLDLWGTVISPEDIENARIKTRAKVPRRVTNGRISGTAA